MIDNPMLTKFDLTDTKGIRDYYIENGYVVLKQVVDESVVSDFLEEYVNIKKSKLFVYYSQSRHLGMRPEISEHGYIKESMQNASRLAFFRSFSSSIQNCLYHSGVATALTAVTGSEKHVSWQNMFFDQSTGTVEHQDSWYLDTDPAGKLVGVWYALEDIHPDCGPFFVIPGSHRIGLLNRSDYPNHDDFVEAIGKKVKSFGVERKPMLLNQGDIILWHPYLIHGAFNSADNSLSRKSFTSHFYPEAAEAKDTESDKLLSIYNHRAPRDTLEPRIKSAFRLSDYFYNFLVFSMFLKDALLSLAPRMKMRRDDYEA